MEYIFTSKVFNIDMVFDDTHYLIPFSDIHRDTKSCDVERWNWFLKKCKDLPQDKCHYIGVGDYHDFASSKEQKIIHNSDLHDQTRDMLDLHVQRNNRDFVKEIGFMKGHLLGMIEGNHSWVFRNGETSTMDLCSRLGTEYLGWLSHIGITIRSYNKGGSRKISGNASMYIVACHGRAGGKLAGTSVNQVDDLKKIFPIADVYIFGHDHQRFAVPTSVLVPSVNNTIKQKRQFLARSGSFKKGYCEGVSGYEVGRLLRPSDLGGVILPFSVHRDQRDNQDRIILDIKAII